MTYELVPLKVEHLIHTWITNVEQRQSYFSQGSVAYCLLADGKPVLAGGIVNMHWHRGEAWMLTTPFFREHLKDCFWYVRATIAQAARAGNFRRVQATCVTSAATSLSLFKHLNFNHEGIMKSFGPNGEDCYMYCRLF